VVVAIEAIKDMARQSPNQQLGETVETHAVGLFTLQLYPNHVSKAVEFKPMFEDNG
jgi:hypothetical protein